MIPAGAPMREPRGLEPGMRGSLIAALAGFATLHLLMGLFSSAPVAGLALFVEAAGGMLWNVVTVSDRRRLIPDALLGRAAVLHGPYLVGVAVCAGLLLYAGSRLRFQG